VVSGIRSSKVTKIVIILILFLFSACTSGNMYHPVHGQDYRLYLWDKEDCELKAKLGGQSYGECMKEWKVVYR
jgi:hypothetical protein